MKMKLKYSLFLIFGMFFADDSFAKSKKPFKGNQKCFDYIIVGFGSAGAILARKLSDDFNVSVLVLEAGENNVLDPVTLSPTPFIFDTTLVYAPNFAATYPILTPAGGAIIYSEGREWGGSAAHNDMQAVRGVPADYNQWGIDSNNPQWLYPNVLPLMKALETYTPDDTIANYTQRGCCGPIGITQNPPIEDDELAIAMAEVTGSPFTSDYNDALLSNVSTNAVQSFVTAGEDARRSFSAYDFTTIGEIIDEKGRGLDGRQLRVRGNAVVSKILFGSGNCVEPKAVGVEYIYNNPDRSMTQVRRVYARNEVILAAGAINTPKILMLSGIGDAHMLQDLGIDVVVDNPNVGAHLQNQYGAIATLAEAEEMRHVLHGSLDVFIHNKPHVHANLKNQYNALTSLLEAKITRHIPGGQLLSFIDERPYMPADEVRRMQIIGVDTEEAKILAGFILKPHSVGAVTITSKDPLIPAQVNMDMYSDGTFEDVGSDAYLTVSFFKIAQAIAQASGHVMTYPTAEQYEEGDAALFAAGLNPSSLAITYHNVGTTRMGTDVTNSVVDGNLHVHGVRNLMIADIGVESTIVSGNTCYSAYIIALVAAQILGVPTPPVL
jgi:choline dehydrogenase